MYDFHTDKDRYFEMQYRVTKDFILPFLQQAIPGKKWERVLEIGCAEAGVLKCFLEEGAFCTGIEMSPSRIEAAQKYHQEALNNGHIEFVNRNVLDIDPHHDLGGTYDLIVLKDVIEHIPRQIFFMAQLPLFLNPDGYIFFAFPPWQMPFGGHQQICRHRLLKKMPYFHLLPGSLYKFILKTAGEPDIVIQELMEIKSTGISIERFEKYLRSNKLSIVGKRHYLFNPIYSFKFGIKPRIQNSIISKIPWFRNFLTSAVYYIVQPK